MGTNFYWQSEPCPTCGHSEEELHIGKSSCGWCFSLHVYPENVTLPQNLEDWKKILSAGKIRNEYGDALTADEMIDKITNRSHPEPLGAMDSKPKSAIWPYENAADFYQKNYAEPGPNNLLRHKIDGRHCIGHGEGTYDYIRGDFS